MSTQRFYHSLTTFISIAVCANFGLAGETYNTITQQKWGPYAVGFKTFSEYDHGRSGIPQYDDHGQLMPNNNPRPMQIGVWYPAKKTSGEPMRFKQYVYLDSIKHNFGELNLKAKNRAEDAYIGQRSFLGQTQDDLLMDQLDLPTHAFWAAEGVSGSFPTVLYVPREDRGIHMHVDLCEFLASHGFIVGATPTRARGAGRITMGTDDIYSGISDLEFLKGFMNHFPNTNKAKVGLLGYGHGGVLATALSIIDPHISAVVNLDGSLEFPFVKDRIKGIPFLQANRVRAPWMYLAGFAEPDPGTDFYDELVYADAYRVKFQKQLWYGFSPYFNYSMVKASTKPEDFDFQQIDTHYDIAARYVKAFFKAYLAEDSRAMAFIRNDSEKNGISKDVLSTNWRQRTMPPPSESYFLQLLENDSQSAVKIYDQAIKVNPKAEIFSNGAMLNQAYRLLGMGKKDEAVAGFRLLAKAFPEDPNVWDSLGEGLKSRGKPADLKEAIKSFKKVLTMNPRQNVRDNSVKLLKELGVDVEKGEEAGSDKS